VPQRGQCRLRQECQREALGRHLALLGRRGPNRISVRHRLEAHALVAEQKIHRQGLDAAGLPALLGREAAGPEYRLAYDLARTRLGERPAFRNFLLVASLALCAGDPPMAFDQLIDALARRPLRCTSTRHRRPACSSCGSARWPTRRRCRDTAWTSCIRAWSIA